MYSVVFSSSPLWLDKYSLMIYRSLFQIHKENIDPLWCVYCSRFLYQCITISDGVFFPESDKSKIWLYFRFTKKESDGLSHVWHVMRVEVYVLDLLFAHVLFVVTCYDRICGLSIDGYQSLTISKTKKMYLCSI